MLFLDRDENELGVGSSVMTGGEGASVGAASLVVTIDVEEDNWGEFKPERITLDNLRKIPDLQNLFDQYGIKPTYLITYPVATDPWAIEMFKNFASEGKCEIGIHCHPWNTPPFEEEVNNHNSMLCHLPEDLQYKKIKVMKDAIIGNFGILPRSFRAGRWAFGESTARALSRVGIELDTSVTSYMDWREYDGVDYSTIGPQIYRFNPDSIFQSNANGEMMQVPASAGFLQNDFSRCIRITRMIEGELLKKLRMKGILDRLNILNKISLSPELCSDSEMVAMSERLSMMGIKTLNMFFHSTSLMEGKSPFVLDREDEIRFKNRLMNFFDYCKKKRIKSVLLRDLLNRS